ncbi:Translocation protein [Mycena sanguinolenta]|uniref:Translocation protein SEC62 n=1 Tax=Mycena sanguinolenta TaxID=230812 RepID=A0A8H6Y0Y6_9AGAR|nr:Translocation protein [Mycena sanguinolenta]
MEQQAKAPPDLRKIAMFLRSGKAGIKVRVGALNGKRFDYFKGKSAIKALLSPAYAKQKGLQKITTEAEAITVLSAINAFAFFLPRPARRARFAPDEYYVWFFEGSQWTTYAGAVLMVGVMLAGVMFPLWPPDHAPGRVLPEHGHAGADWAVFRDCYCAADILHHHPGGGEPRDMDFPEVVCGCGLCESSLSSRYTSGTSPRKSQRRKRATRRAPPRPAPESNGTGGAFIEEVEDSGNSRPHSRAARVEEVEDEDA